MSGFTAADVPPLHGRTALVTGANTGIGYCAAEVMAAMGARVLLGCRDHARAAAARNRILQALPYADIAWLPLDLADLASVRRAAEVVSKEPRLDLLVNNAGVMRPPLRHTADGFELQFGVNHLGHFALAGLLLKKLGGPDPRIVTVASIAHRRGRIDFDNLDGAKGYDATRFYAQSKLANLVFALELDRRLRAAGSPVKSIACHPGLAGTELGRNGIDKLAFRMAGLLFNSSAQGAWPTLQAATEPAAQSGEYFGPQGIGETRGKSGPARPSDHARDAQLGRRLWDVSVEMTGVDPGLAPASA